MDLSEQVAKVAEPFIGGKRAVGLAVEVVCDAYIRAAESAWERGPEEHTQWKPVCEIYCRGHV